MLLLDREAVLNAIAGNTFPVCRESHHIQKRGFADLSAIFDVIIDNIDQCAFKFQKILFGEQVTECDDQTEQISFPGKILIPLFLYVQLLMKQSIWKINLGPERIESLVMCAYVPEQGKNFQITFQVLFIYAWKILAYTALHLEREQGVKPGNLSISKGVGQNPQRNVMVNFPLVDDIIMFRIFICLIG